ncbi:unnamed protein product [Durusdinium trenchii]|uniref:Uncharacterized protein n=1 Tax=Durusdinium trenchii TaxID=1381693 RepID=A0ABP0JSH5_9DINO
MLAALVYSMPNLNWMDPKDHTELFSGCGSVTRGELQEGRSVFAYDIEYNREFMDIMSPQGYALAIFAVLNTKRAGGLTLAPVCSTWVFMSRGSTLRSRARPLGSGKGSCRTGSIMAARCAILILLAAARGVVLGVGATQRVLVPISPPHPACFEPHQGFQETYSDGRLWCAFAETNLAVYRTDEWPNPNRLSLGEPKTFWVCSLEVFRLESFKSSHLWRACSWLCWFAKILILVSTKRVSGGSVLELRHESDSGWPNTPMGPHRVVSTLFDLRVTNKIGRTW